MEDKEKTFDEVKDVLAFDGNVTDAQEDVIVKEARREHELDRAKATPAKSGS